jgi:HlyD family secretion protein
MATIQHETEVAPRQVRTGADGNAPPVEPADTRRGAPRWRAWLPVALVLVGAAVWLYQRNAAGDAPTYRFESVERGDIEAAVSSTGTLNADTTVQVGTQVSGQVSAIYVDFNDRVRKGQLLARIDPTLSEQVVRDAQAGIARAQAEQANAQRTYDRNRQLFDRKVLTEVEYSNAQYALDVAKAGTRSAQVALERAQRNLAYTRIEAPIDGIIVQRNVDVGQTVAASLQAPQLFLIANDLTHLQIVAQVDESDIGQIQPGQAVKFTVQAYPTQTFNGTVKQVRLQSTTTENVVNYPAVVSVANPNGKLLPGMTATVNFITGSAQNVFVVPNAALRFRPSEEQLARAGLTNDSGMGRDSASRGGASASATPRRTRTQSDFPFAGPLTAGSSGRTSPSTPGGFGSLWYLDATGKLARLRVRTGLSDGQRTQVSGDGLREGMQVIIGSTEATTGTTGATSPFQTTRQQGGPRPPGF